MSAPTPTAQDVETLGEIILSALCASPIWAGRHIGELEYVIADGVAERLLAADYLPPAEVARLVQEAKVGVEDFRIGRLRELLAQYDNPPGRMLKTLLAEVANILGPKAEECPHPWHRGGKELCPVHCAPGPVPDARSEAGEEKPCGSVSPTGLSCGLVASEHQFQSPGRLLHENEETGIRWASEGSHQPRQEAGA